MHVHLRSRDVEEGSPVLGATVVEGVEQLAMEGGREKGPVTQVRKFLKKEGRILSGVREDTEGGRAECAGMDHTLAPQPRRTEDGHSGWARCFRHRSPDLPLPFT